MMSRKDYVALAAVIREEWNKTDLDSTERALLSRVIVYMVAVFAADNSNFDAMRFIAACIGADELTDDGLMPAAEIANMDEATEFTINAYPDRESVNAHDYAIKVTWRGGDRWAVMHRGNCLGVDGSWSHEPLPSSRTDEWKSTHRFDRDTALRLAREAAPKVTVAGISIPGMVAWEASQEG